MTVKKLVYYFIALYVISIPINRGMVLPIIGEKLQLPELVFLALAFSSIPLFLKIKLKNINLIGIDWGLAFYFLAVVASYLFHPTHTALLDVAGLIYLLVLYTIINFYFVFYEPDKSQIKFLITKFSAISLLVLNIIGLVGFAFVLLGFKTELAIYYPNYPFFGNVYRIRAFTQEPVMMASILSVFILTVMAGFNLTGFTLKERKWLKIILVLSFISLALTITKSAVITFAAAFAIYSIQQNKLSALKPFLWGMSLVALLVFTHFVVVRSVNFDAKKSYHGLADKPVLSIGNYYVVQTDYYYLKKAAIISGERFWLTGIGSGNFSDYLPTLKQEGLYPTKFRDYDPISTYFGAYAELGVFGLLALLFLYFQVFKTLNRLKNQNLDDLWLASLISIFGFMACESFVTDTMNFRHYWWVLACVAVYVRIQEAPKKL